MRTLIATSLVMLALGTLVALADDRDPANPKSRTAGQPALWGADRGNRADRTERSDAEREAAALAFVRENHPELADLLEQLKAMKPDQYERAINELWQVSRTLANYKKNEKRRYQPALDVWKARSRAELLAAQLASTPGRRTRGQVAGGFENTARRRDPPAEGGARARRRAAQETR